MLNILQLRHNAMKKPFLYLLIACTLFVYIYSKIAAMSNKPINFASDKDDDFNNYSEKGIDRMNAETILSLKTQVKDINSKQRIQNLDSYGFEVTLVIVIQVHNKKYYLDQLIDSLNKTKGIMNALIIFSHSYCDEEINISVQNITFARVMQIFYPFSVQLHPNVFPGNDHKVCKDGINCINKERNALLAQTKHHWWWTTAFVFEDIRVTKYYDGFILFIEEDQYVTEDFLYVFRVMERLLKANYPECNLINLGNKNVEVENYHVKNTTIALKPWTSKEDFGIAFDRSLWNTIKKLSDRFCRYDDYSWTNSLRNLAKYSQMGKFYVLSIDSPRIFRFDKCSDTNKTRCHMVEKVEVVQEFVRNIQKHLYPQKMIIKKSEQQEKDLRNGGWNDSRDHEFCMLFTSKYRHLAI